MLTMPSLMRVQTKGYFHMQLEFHGASFINIQNIYYMIISK